MYDTVVDRMIQIQKNRLVDFYFFIVVTVEGLYIEAHAFFDVVHLAPSVVRGNWLPPEPAFLAPIEDVAT